MFNIIQVRKGTILMFVVVNRIIGDSKLQFGSGKEKDFIVIVENRKYKDKDKVNDRKKETVGVVVVRK